MTSTAVDDQFNPDQNSDTAFEEANQAINDYPPQRHAHDALSSIEEVLKHGELTHDQLQELSNVMPTLREISRT